MSGRIPLYSLSISARATLDMHSLNNEGGEGNQIQTRMVNVVDAEGRRHNVNAISGDMFKHIQAEHLFRLASDGGGLPLCAACQTFNANRISADVEYGSSIGNKSDAEAIDLMLQRCALDDLAGNLITAGNRSIPRKSVAEFSWVVGVPNLTTTDSYFHVKYASERGSAQRQSNSSDEGREAHLGQAIFHRPASSGVYGAVLNLELARIGFNDISQRYAVDDEQRQKRHAALLESVMFTLLEPNGAMRGTQNPHLVCLEGIVATSCRVVPAPTMSPLDDRYREELERIHRALNSLHADALSLYSFDSAGQFAEIMAQLVQTTQPLKLRYPA